MTETNTVAKCGYRVERGLWAPLVCGREKNHRGTHIDFETWPRVSVGFAWDHGADTRLRIEPSKRGAS